jgi:hypothetical protein
MSIISVNHLCRDVMRDPALRKRLRDDPPGELAKYPRKLSQAERAALLAGDIATLSRMGANAFLMGYLGRYEVFGLDPVMYGERMHATLEMEKP